MAPTPLPPNPMDEAGLLLDEIQGNILDGFNNDHQRFCFLHIHDTLAARTWIGNLKVNFTTEVKAANDQRKRDIEDCKKPKDACWLNIAFNYAGLNMLGAKDTGHFPEEFREGMAHRHRLIGDIGANDPHLWDPWATDPSSMHVIILLAADNLNDLNKKLSDLIASLPGSGLTLMHLQAGEAPPGEAAPNEHFGFRDGISQPGVKGYTLSADPTPTTIKAHQGKPGQDLLWPGEFVVGYPTQNKDRPGLLPDNTAFDGPNPDPVPYVVKEPDWAVNGSYLVFRKLQQDVAGFRNSIRSTAVHLGVDPEVLGAKIVGRFRSGCPMEQLKVPIPGVDTNNGDPSGDHPEMLDSSHNVFFEYGNDVQGDFLPRAGHIRKAYPRDEQLLDEDGTESDTGDLHESATQTHRIMRRGIPFGGYMSTTAGGLNDIYVDDQVSRGLLFLCYQSSIARQFEFIQATWINNHNFPDANTGVDPVMSQVKTAPMKCPFHNKPAPNILDLKHYVTTNGGEYFFQPSLTALRKLSGSMAF